MKIAVCLKHVVTRDARRARRRGADVDPRSRRQLRAERAGRLRARRGAAPQGEAGRRSDRRLGRPGPRHPGAARGAGPRRRSRHPRRRRGAGPGRRVGGRQVAGRGAEGRRRRPRAHRPAVRRSGLRPGRRDPGRGARPVARDDRHGSAGRPATALRVRRELEGGWFQWVAMPLPALLTIQSGINQLRYATLKGIMAAKKKEIRVVAAPAGLTPLVEIRGAGRPGRSRSRRG